MRELTPLCHLANKYQTDKGGRDGTYAGVQGGTCHEYTPIYWDLLHEKREQVKVVLEIGVNSGASLRVWEEFFPKAQIIGLDIRRECLFNEGRIRCFYADQSNPESLRAALLEAGAGFPCFDLIVDDGSHEHDHILTSLTTLAPFLSWDGIYVVEDIRIDCHPELVGDHTPEGFCWSPYKAEPAMGGAHCDPGCPTCNGTGVEQLVVVRRCLCGAHQESFQTARAH